MASHPACLYGFLAAAFLGALYCFAPFDSDPQGRIFRGLLAKYAAYLCTVAVIIPNLRRQGDEPYSQLLSRFARIRGFDRPQALSFEKNWFAVTACFTGLSFLIPLYALSKIILSWSEIGWPDVVGSPIRPGSCEFLGLPEDCDVTESYIKPHGRRLADGRQIAWSRATEWKATLLALHERSIEPGGRPHGAVLFEAGTKDPQSRSVVESAARKLDIEKLIWID